MSVSRVAKINKFREQAQIDLEGETHICPPGCRVQHDAKWTTYKSPVVVKQKPMVKISPYKNYWVGVKWYNVEGEEIESIPPIRKRLEHHARMHGPVEVQAVADFFAVPVDIAEFKDPSAAIKAKKRKSRPVPKTAQALTLVQRGVPWTEIEDHLNLNRYSSAKLKMELEESSGRTIDQLYAGHERSVRGVAEATAAAKD